MFWGNQEPRLIKFAILLYLSTSEISHALSVTPSSVYDLQKTKHWSEISAIPEKKLQSGSKNLGIDDNEYSSIVEISDQEASEEEVSGGITSSTSMNNFTMQTGVAASTTISPNELDLIGQLRKRDTPTPKLIDIKSFSIDESLSLRNPSHVKTSHQELNIMRIFPRQDLQYQAKSTEGSAHIMKVIRKKRSLTST
ncbi:hypothetical protein QAD02_011736 [Eretmocerus hayati]|uniref:Uncharacterized protein n=1 Tax=Eretmocerus hayati TaxID=131215 RepID=A0ACC2NXN1_9HYME|nr:hypothetical protein QAD02_011736 [Eretmocerus hayati]